MTDRNVIVYRDGSISGVWPSKYIDEVIEISRDLRLPDSLSPAYRIRIREKAKSRDVQLDHGWLMRDINKASQRLAPQSWNTGRTVAAGAEKPWSVPDVGPGKPV